MEVESYAFPMDITTSLFDVCDPCSESHDHLSWYLHMARQRKSKGADISAITLNHGDEDADVDVSAFGDKSSIGKTGVHLRNCKSNDYKVLTTDQKMELAEWR